jgi:large subunit ribosomal protein L25
MSTTRPTLEVTKRDAGNKGIGRRLRASGLIPGVIYGNKVEPVPVAIEPKKLFPVLTTDYGFNAVFNVECDGVTYQCMMKDRQFNPVRRNITHVDLYVVKNEQTVELNSPVSTVGRSAGEKLGGRLQIVSRTVRIRCKVADVPPSIPHDVTTMELGEAIYITQMTPPEGCEFVYRHRFPVIRIARKRGAKVAADGEAEA